MHRFRFALLAGLAACSMAVFAGDRVYKVDEDKLPEWVKRAGDAPYKVIMDNAVVHVRAPARAASAVPARKAVVAPTSVVAKSAPPGTVPAPVQAIPVARPSPDSEPVTTRPEPPVNVAALQAKPAALPAAAPTPPAPPAPPAPPSIGRLCPTQTPPEMPRDAAEHGVGGTVKVRALVQGGVVREVTILSGSPTFRGVVRAAMKTYRCVESDQPVSVEQTFVFETP